MNIKMEQVRYTSTIHHPEIQPVYVESINRQPERLTLPYFTKYEFVSLIATRAQQISDGSQVLDSVADMDTQFPCKMAEKELLNSKLPFIVHRRLPNGNSEFWNASELRVNW
jgi:DNA-directed RNA polymerase subunit K/omega